MAKWRDVTWRLSELPYPFISA